MGLQTNKRHESSIAIASHSRAVKVAFLAMFCMKIFSIPFLVAGKSSTPAATQSVTKSPSIWKRSRRSRPVASTNSTVRIIETQIFTKNGTWVHESWTDALTKDIADSPKDMVLNATSVWLGEWKIALSTSTSRHGWKYLYDKENQGPILKYTIRQRTWLRSVQHKKASRRTKRSKLLRAIRDDWNFKGFGVSLYKSVLFPKSKGVSFRIPLTYNFGIWERHPAWPSLGLTVSVFHPPIYLGINGSASIRMKWVQWALSYWNQLIPAAAASILIFLLRGLALAVSALLYPLTRRPLLVAIRKMEARKTSLPDPQYSQSVEEWIGVTWTWAPLQSLTRIRVFYWHFYAVQLAALYDGWDWIPRHSAALGWSLVGPVVDSSELLCTASLCMSLSGFYFRDPHREKLSVSSTTLSSAETRTKTLASQRKGTPAKAAAVSS